MSLEIILPAKTFFRNLEEKNYIRNTKEFFSNTMSTNWVTVFRSKYDELEKNIRF